MSVSVLVEPPPLLRVPDSQAGAVDDTPWRFLRPLGDRAEDRDLISLTRPAELRAVTNMVSSARASILYAMSGNGKTSLINAGVIPHFTKLGYVTFRTRPRPPWCLTDPTLAFKESILRHLRLPLVTDVDLRNLQGARARLTTVPQADSEQVTVALLRLEEKLSRFQAKAPYDNDLRKYLEAKRDVGLRQFVADLRTVLEPDVRLLAVCDQFEEAFVHFSGTAALHRFIDELGELCADSSLQTSLLFSLREDWVGSMIEFRAAIPDIFHSYYKLNPILRSQARQILSAPLARVGFAWQNGVLDRVLDDLVANHAANERVRLGQAAAAPMNRADPFLESPALQIVADRLWHTRTDYLAPFSDVHYEGLAPLAPVSEGDAARGDSIATPVDRVLDMYLDDQLRMLSRGEGAAQQMMRELRVDCLHLLTDGVAHRRALQERVLIDELNRLRPELLQLPRVDKPLLDRALRPLTQMKLVDHHDGIGGHPQYELAHDFAVRAVAREWGALNRSRIVQLAAQSEAFEQGQLELGRYNRRDKLSGALILAGGFAGIVALGVILVLLSAEAIESTGLWRLIWFTRVLFACVAALAFGRAERRGTLLGAAGLIVLGAWGGWIALYPKAEQRTVPAALQSSEWRKGAHLRIIGGSPQPIYAPPPIAIHGMLTDREVAAFVLPITDAERLTITATVSQGDAELAVASLAGEILEYDDDSGGQLDSSIEWSTLGNPVVVICVTNQRSTGSHPYALQIRSTQDRTPTEIAATDDATRWASRSLRDEILSELHVPGLPSDESVLFLLSVMPLFFCLWLLAASSIARRHWSTTAAFVLSMMAAELIDMIILVALASAANYAGTFVLRLTNSDWILVSFAASLVIAVAALAVVLWLTKRTIGLWIAGFTMLTSDLKPLTFPRALMRQTTFLAWTVMNVFGIPWLLIGPIVMSSRRRHENIYDLLCRTVVVPRGEVGSARMRTEGTVKDLSIQPA
jgi:RDD family